VLSIWSICSLAELGNPQILWSSPRLEDKRAVLKLTFASHLEYVRDEGFRTPETAVPFRVLADLTSQKMKWRTRQDSNL